MSNSKRKYKCIISALICTMILPVTLSSPHKVLATESNPTITINADDIKHKLSDGLYATNHRYFQDGVGMWDSVNQKVYKDFTDAYEKTGMKSIRYPGGTCSNTFWFTRAIGDVAQRKQEVNSYRGYAGEVATFGVHEMMDFAKETDSEVFWVYNAVNGNAEDFGHLLQYLNAPNDGKNEWAALRAKNGHSEPYNVTAFDLGNEMFTINKENWIYEGTGYKDYVYDEKTQTITGVGDPMNDHDMYAHGSYVYYKDKNAVSDEDWTANTKLGNGQPNQRKTVKYGPFLKPETVVVKVDGEMWTYVKNLEGQAPDAKVFTIERGKTNQDNYIDYIVFGDGNTGAVLPEGKAVTVSYWSQRDGIDDYVRVMNNLEKTLELDFKLYGCNEVGTGETAKKNIAIASDTGYDGITYHPYLMTFPSSDNAYNITDSTKYRYFALATQNNKIQELDEIRHLLNEYGQDLIITEFMDHMVSFSFGNASSPSYPDSFKQSGFASMGSVVYTMNMYNYAFNTNMKYAFRHSLVDKMFITNNSAAGMAAIDGDTFIIQPAGYMYELMSGMSGEKLVSSKVDNNLKITGYDGIAKQDTSLDSLLTIASRSGNDLYLLVINNNMTEDIKANININGDYTVSNSEVWVLDSTDPEIVNTKENPYNVTLNKTGSINTNDSNLSYTFPTCSVVGIKLTLNNKQANDGGSDNDSDNNSNNGSDNNSNNGSSNESKDSSDSNTTSGSDVVQTSSPKTGDSGNTIAIVLLIGSIGVLAILHSKKKIV